MHLVHRLGLCLFRSPYYVFQMHFPVLCCCTVTFYVGKRKEVNVAARNGVFRDVNSLKKDHNAKIVCHYWDACSLKE